ncbi:hypothetical protein FSB65_41660, partial [Paraburkholderia sp. JPY418]|nr:hypothetical protein [Paraburkholderia youngii]
VKAAARHGLKLRQNYNREAPRLARQIGRYAHAKQYKRMKKALRTLRSRVGLRRGITHGLRAMSRRRSAIEPAIGHMKADGKLDRNWLKGALG